jgi:hypothetical protein
MGVRTRRSLFLVSFWCVAALAAAPDRASVAVAGTGGGSGDRPRAILAGANVDTLDYSWREVLPAAVAELEKSDWRIQRADSTERRVVTHWKPLRHTLAKLFMGEVQAKVVVDFGDLGDDRTVVTVRGGLASDRDIEGSPVLGAAQKSYRSATERWMERVRRRLDDGRTASGRSAASTF